MGFRNFKKAINEMKNLDISKLGDTVGAGREVFEKFRTDLIQIQMNQLEFEAYLKAILHNQASIMKELKCNKDFKVMEDYFDEPEKED